MKVTESDWGNYALAFIEEYASSVDHFSANDLWQAGLAEPDNAMWVGLVLRSAAARGLIKKVGYVPTERGNGGIIMRWRAA